MHFIPNIISIMLLYNIFFPCLEFELHTPARSRYHLLSTYWHTVPLKKGGELGGKSIPLTYMNHCLPHKHTYIHTQCSRSQVSKLNVTNTCACMCTGFYVICGVLVHNKHTLSWPSKIILPGSTVCATLCAAQPNTTRVFMCVHGWLCAIVYGYV